MQTDSSPDRDVQRVNSSVAPQIKGFMPWSEDRTPYAPGELKREEAAKATQAAMSPLDRLNAKLQQLEHQLAIGFSNPSSDEWKIRGKIATLKAEIAKYKSGGRKTRSHRKRRMTRRR